MVLHRHLSRTYTHRRALLRNLTTALIENESIITTLAKAKEAQSFAERVISYTKYKNIESARSLAQADLFRLKVTLPKLFNELADRYKDREGGYTRVLKLEARQGDKAPQAILELVDGKKEIKFWLCARIVAKQELEGSPIDEITSKNVEKLIKFKPNGQEEFRKLVDTCKEVFYNDLTNKVKTTDEQSKSDNKKIVRSIITRNPPKRNIEIVARD